MCHLVSRSYLGVSSPQNPCHAFFLSYKSSPWSVALNLVWALSSFAANLSAGTTWTPPAPLPPLFIPSFLFYFRSVAVQHTHDAWRSGWAHTHTHGLWVANACSISKQGMNTASFNHCAAFPHPIWRWHCRRDLPLLCTETSRSLESDHIRWRPHGRGKTCRITARINRDVCFGDGDSIWLTRLCNTCMLVSLLREMSIQGFWPRAMKMRAIKSCKICGAHLRGYRVQLFFTVSDFRGMKCILQL